VHGVQALEVLIAEGINITAVREVIEWVDDDGFAIARSTLSGTLDGDCHL
jgi:hypothetical protein